MASSTTAQPPLHPPKMAAGDRAVWNGPRSLPCPPWAPPRERLHLAMHAADRDDPEPKALACYGLWLPEPGRTLLRFVAGRPVSGVTRAFLAWIAGQLAAEGACGSWS